ncbi:hypothetical protein [Herbidospora cretacea]|uniref:hypothetical protein n=1 Tax=Herbidospora cretacea TaxID=28444 RepID=UPI0012F8A295|nr:hypothetical protein [Herbidospora cretacea]
MAEDLTDIYPDAIPPESGHVGVDVLNTPGLAIEVKARRNFRPLEWSRQAARNSGPGDIPLNVVRMTGQGPAALDEWLTFTPWRFAKLLIKKAGYGTATPSLGTGSASANSQADSFWTGDRLARYDELSRALQTPDGATILREMDALARR